jgi:hypothetical protein
MSPTTSARLRGLKPGEFCRWYAGDIAGDIKSSAAIPAYAQLLTDLHREVVTLEKQGFLVLSTRKASREIPPQGEGDKPQRVTFNVYVATRVQP